MAARIARVERTLSVLALLAMIAGCASDKQDTYFRDSGGNANVYVAPVPCDVAKVAIMPFKAPTELIGASVSDLFVTEMLRAGRYELVERGQMSKVLSEAELSMAGLSETKAVEIGSMLGADGVIIGTVDEYGSVAQSGKAYPSVGISVRMIHCKSGKVMWSADLADRANSAGTTLPQHSRSVVHALTAGLYQQWDVQTKVKRADPPPKAVARATPRVPASPPPESLPPSAPQDFSVSDMGLREVVLSWPKPAGTTHRYRIERGLKKDGPFVALDTVSADKLHYKDTGTRNDPLKDGAPYYYRLVAVSKTGVAGPPSAVKESLTAPPPEPPASIRVELPAARAVKLVWSNSPSEGVVKYLVDRTCDAEPGPFVPVAEVEETTFAEGGKADSPLKDSTKYFYRIQAVNRVGAAGTPSKPVEVVTRPPPAPVRNLKAGGDEVRCVPLSWDASPEEDVVRYDLYRADGKDTEFQKLASLKGRTTTRHLDGAKDPGTLQDNHEYVYKIRAVNAVTSESADPDAVAAVTRAPPPTVTGMKAESNRPREVPLTWTMSPDGKVVGYEIHRSQEGEATAALIATAEGRETVSFTDRGKNKKSAGLGTLADGKAYAYQILAFNTAKATAPLAKPATATTKPVPTAPAGSTATTKLPRSVKIQWKASPEKDVEAYVVEGADAPGGKFRAVATVPAAAEGGLIATDEKVPDGAKRFYRIKAVDHDTLESVWSDVAEGATKPLPDAPKGLKAEWENDGAALAWTAPAQPDIKEYRVWKEGLLKWDPISTTDQPTCTVPLDKIGKKATFAVTAIDADGLESERGTALSVAVPKSAK